MQLGFPVAIPFRPNARNHVKIASNCAELRGILRSLQGSHLRANKIPLCWKPYIYAVFEINWNCEEKKITRFL